jgi:hypothetical protein
MKRIIILIGVIVFWSSCQNNYKRPTFFVNMNKLSEFVNVDNKSELKGFDRIQLSTTNKKIQGNPCWLLSTPENGNFDIEGLIWFKDNIVYINTKEVKYFNESNNQILFNFGKVDTAWIVNYHRGKGFPPYLVIRKEVRINNSDIKDSTTVFNVQEHLKNCSWTVNEFLVEISLKYGFVSIAYRENNYEYIIDFIPVKKFSKKLFKADLNMPE